MKTTPMEEAIARLEANSGSDRPTQFWDDVRELIEFAKGSTWEWGWVARFEDGEEWDSNEGLSEDRARSSVKHGNEDEEYLEETRTEPEDDPDAPRVFYTLRKRKVANPGPWEEVE